MDYILRATKQSLPFAFEENDKICGFINLGCGVFQHWFVKEDFLLYKTSSLLKREIRNHKVQFCSLNNPNTEPKNTVYIVYLKVCMNQNVCEHVRLESTKTAGPQGVVKYLPNMYKHTVCSLCLSGLDSEVYPPEHVVVTSTISPSLEIFQRKKPK